MTTLFRKISGGMPVDWMLCEPAAFQVQVTLAPAAIVSTAGFWLPFCALRKKMLPTVTWTSGPSGRGSPYRKSSITTRSWVPPALTSVLVALNAASPLVIKTRATIADSNTAPTKVNPWAPRWAGDAMLASSTPFASKYSTRVAAALSTSEKTTPKPLTKPLVVVPASLKSTSTWFEPTAMNSFLGEKALNWSARPALIDAKALLSTRSPVPGVDISTPRFELTLKKVAGNVSTLVKAAGTPSQLISRRPLSVGGELGAFKLPPSAARNLFRVSATVRLSPWARITAKLGPGDTLVMGEERLLHAARATRLRNGA